MDARAHTDDHTPYALATTGPGRAARVVAGLLLALLLAPLLALVAAAPASAKIEDYPRYQPQTRCSPAAKVGTLRLATYLLHHGGGDLGISRSCKIGGTSEHKEGRAFDWALDATSKHDRKLAHVVHRHGRARPTSTATTDALARRMGIMYILWNDHILVGVERLREGRLPQLELQVGQEVLRDAAAPQPRAHLDHAARRPGASCRGTSATASRRSAPTSSSGRLSRRGP